MLPLSGHDSLTTHGRADRLRVQEPHHIHVFPMPPSDCEWRKWTQRSFAHLLPSNGAVQVITTLSIPKTINKISVLATSSLIPTLTRHSR